MRRLLIHVYPVFFFFFLKKETNKHMENNNNLPIARPPRRAKTQALQYIREYTERQLAARANPTLPPAVEDEGLLSSDSDDSEYHSEDETASSSDDSMDDSLENEDDYEDEDED